MPSKLPVIKANTTDNNINKMKYIAKYNKRSLAKELEYIVEPVSYTHLDVYKRQQ